MQVPVRGADACHPVTDREDRADPWALLAVRGLFNIELPSFKEVLNTFIPFLQKKKTNEISMLQPEMSRSMWNIHHCWPEGVGQ